MPQRSTFFLQELSNWIWLYNKININWYSERFSSETVNSIKGLDIWDFQAPIFKISSRQLPTKFRRYINSASKQRTKTNPKIQFFKLLTFILIINLLFVSNHGLIIGKDWQPISLLKNIRDSAIMPILEREKQNKSFTKTFSQKSQ